MKKQRIEEIKRNLNNPNQSYYAGKGESMWKDLKEAIVEIESLEKNLKKVTEYYTKANDDWCNILQKNEKLEKKIEELEKKNEILQTTLDDSDNYKRFLQLQAVREAAEEYRQAKEKLIRNKTDNNMANASIKYAKLTQALAAKDKDD